MNPWFSRLLTWLINGVNDGSATAYSLANSTNNGPKTCSTGWYAAAGANASAENGPRSGARPIKEANPPAWAGTGRAKGHAGGAAAVELTPDLDGEVDTEPGDVSDAEVDVSVVVATGALTTVPVESGTVTGNGELPTWSDVAPAEPGTDAGDAEMVGES